MQLRDVVVHEGKPLLVFDFILRVLGPVDQIIGHSVMDDFELLLHFHYMHVVFML